MPAVASQGLLDELARWEKVEALDASLAELAAEEGPPSAAQEADAVAWADSVLGAEPGAMDRPAPTHARRTA